MRLITIAIHTYERALATKALLEAEGIAVVLQNVNLEQPEVSSGVRIRIAESDLPLALRVIENEELFKPTASQSNPRKERHSICVPTDFSEHAFKAACVAARLAKSHDADLCFIHSYIAPPMSRNVQLSDNLTYELIDAKDDQELHAEAEAEMQKMVARLKELMRRGEIPAVKCTYEILEGVPEDAIVEYAKLNPAYLTVMGTRTSGRKERELIGSVTAEVLDESRFTVLTIPETLSIADSSVSPKNILFFSNLDQEDILAIDTLYRYFPEPGAKVTIVHVPRRVRFTDRAAGRSAIALSDYCSKKFTDYTFETVPMTQKTAIVELEAMQKRHSFDMIVVPNRRSNAFSRLFNPGLAHKILFEADIPMLVIPV